MTVAFRSPAVTNVTLPALYTCDGRDVPPPLEWGAVHAPTRELALFVIALQPDPAAHAYTTSVEWAVAGIDPEQRRLAAGEIPRGAYVGLTSQGRPMRYTVCPARGEAKTYEFALYALPESVAVPKRFVGALLLAQLANPRSSTVAVAGGAFAATYKRPAATSQ